MTTFAELGIDEDIIKGLLELGFKSPTPVQEQLIPIALNQHIDIVGLAQTGTGKTAAFGIPLIQLSDAANKKVQALVLCPTRELCMQVAKDMTAFAKYVPGFNIVPVYGGASIDTQIRALRKGAQIVIATPGRLHDMIRRKAVDISAITSVVLDEADEMLQMGFKDELNAILATTPDTKNTLLLSATMPKGVANITKNYMNKPLEITVGQRNMGTENVRHIYYMVRAKDRYQALRRIADNNPDIYSIIFCRTRQETNDVADKLMQDGYNADALHGDLSQAQRDEVMKKFHRRSLQMLVATDVAARGLDVTDLTHVINYNLPDETANYTHRSGRTGRAGKSGVSIAIIHMREKYRIREIENIIKRKFEQGQIPSAKEVCEKQLLRLLDNITRESIDVDSIEPFMPAIRKSLADLDREELIKRFVSLEFKRFIDHYKNAPDLNVTEEEHRLEQRGARGDKFAPRAGGPGDKFGPRAGGQKFTRFEINIGKEDGIYPARLIGQINESTGIRNIKIGRIDIQDHSSLMEADSKFADLIMTSFGHLMINGKNIAIKITGERVENPGQGFGRKPHKTPFRGKSAGPQKGIKKNFPKKKFAKPKKD
ncbi:MAG: DEAD/DEAH box helicase [Desulfobulbaceae bacterium]|nr:DEAD/DEAH box helicase [Desulfobulbaceae bacterium]HIJ78778.1 DEAD/DEAH box helicase [Deltaproteobacteria bacterium]